MSHKKRVEALEKLADQRQIKNGQANVKQGLSDLSEAERALLSTIDPDVFRRATARRLQEQLPRDTGPLAPAPAPVLPAPVNQIKTRPGYFPNLDRLLG